MRVSARAYTHMLMHAAITTQDAEWLVSPLSFPARVSQRCFQCLLDMHGHAVTSAHLTRALTPTTDLYTLQRLFAWFGQYRAIGTARRTH